MVLPFAWLKICLQKIKKIAISAQRPRYKQAVRRKMKAFMHCNVTGNATGNLVSPRNITAHVQAKLKRISRTTNCNTKLYMTAKDLVPPTEREKSCPFSEINILVPFVSSQ